MRKLIIGVVLLPITWFASAAMHFPRVFQVMFVLYVILGTVVFLLLDAPPVPKIGGWKAGAMLVLFYALISGVFVVGASLLPQYDPTVEKGKIDKIVKPKMETPESRHAKLEELLKKSQELQAKADTLTAQLNKIAPVRTPAAGVPSGEPADHRGWGGPPPPLALPGAPVPGLPRERSHRVRSGTR